MLRGTFVQLAAAALGTGGQDLWDAGAPPSGPAPNLRVLIAADRAGQLPQALDAATFAFDGKRWRGTPALAPLPGGREGILTTLDVDAYLYGVLPLEASPSWAPGALQAQAIVARTYALARRTLSRPYDVTAGESDQRYGGVDVETATTSFAVDATRGRTLSFGGGPASVFYAACCGGHTADAADVWGHTALPYLRGVADPYCTGAPDYRWQRSVPMQRLAAALGPRAPGTIGGFVLGPADAGGRPLTLDVVGSSGRVTLTTVEFRRLIGADIVRSTWIRAVALQGAPAPEALVSIEGSGRGHGVGLCQWGARGMGAAGASAAQILAFYFPGTAIAGG